MNLYCDVECYRDYFLVSFMNDQYKTKSFEMYDDHPLDIEGVLKFMGAGTLVTFNGNNYDLPMIALALKSGERDMSCDDLKAASDLIIIDEMKPWIFEKEFKAKTVWYNHIDLIEVAPGDVSLKIYGGRLHAPKMQDLPIEPHAHISEEDRGLLKLYNKNDLLVTKMLSDKLAPQIALRKQMSSMYSVDLRSKSDAQIAEAVLKHEVEKVTGVKTPKSKSRAGDSFFYKPPSYVRFKTDYLKNIFTTICEAPMVVDDNGYVQLPDVIEKMTILVGSTSYKIGIGGIHSQESEVCHRSSDEEVLRDIDVESYYPNLMLNMGMFPSAFGPEFLSVYRTILQTRLVAKKNKDMVVSDVLKIVLNGTFGKTSNRYSTLYNPEMTIQTTLTGQLSLLMLIEFFEIQGIRVVSANTDGIVTKCPVTKIPVMDKIVKLWEERCNLKMEETRYKSLYSRDVNNYIAIKLDGDVKTKGVFRAAGLVKNPQNDICAKAVVDFLSKGVPIKKTIRSCDNIRMFLSLRTVRGGAVKNDHYLGKAVRWYYSSEESGTINYKANGNTVPRTDKARPLMDLPSEFPKDVDFSWYEKECEELLMQVGVVKRPPVVKLPRKNSKEWKAKVEAGDILIDAYGKGYWNELP